MGEHSSYHQSIPGDEAKRRLKKSGYPHCYLTRYSETDRQYKLTIYKKQRPSDIVKHFVIVIDNGGRHKIDGKEEDFDSIQELLEHYEQNRIDPAFKTIGTNYSEALYDGRICTIL